jgi:hypothetical protein
MLVEYETMGSIARRLRESAARLRVTWSDGLYRVELFYPSPKGAVQRCVGEAGALEEAMASAWDLAASLGLLVERSPSLSATEWSVTLFYEAEVDTLREVAKALDVLLKARG